MFIIHKKNNNRPLSYFYHNSNGKVKDIIGFSFKSYFSFDSKERAEGKIENMKREIRERTDFDLKLSINLFNIFDNLSISEVL